MEKLQASAAAREALGEPITAGWFANGAVNEYGGDLGWANLDIPVSGSRGQGTLHLQANQKAGVWRYNRITLSLRGSADGVRLARKGRSGAAP